MNPYRPQPPYFMQPPAMIRVRCFKCSYRAELLAGNLINPCPQCLHQSVMYMDQESREANKRELAKEYKRKRRR